MAEMDIPGNDLSIPRTARKQTFPRKQDLSFGDSTPTEDSSLSENSLVFLLNGKTCLGTPNLPLTPPSLPPDSTISYDTRQSTSPQIADNPLEGTTGFTAASHADTLTPNVTLSRAATLPRTQEAQDPIYLSMSSREESFTTAKEALSSDEEKEKMSPDGGNRSISESGHSTPKQHTAGGTAPIDFATFGGQRDDIQGGNSRGLGKHVENTMQEGLSSVYRGDSRSSIQDTEVTDRNPIIRKFADDIGPVDSQEKPGGNTESRNRRLSGTSVNSTITIEAIVIDVPQQKKRMLRHIRKNESLRSSSLPVRPARNRDAIPSDSTETQRRLSHRSARLSNQDRGSIRSDMSLNPTTVSHRRKPLEEVIPVVVIPQRRSSLKGGSTRSSRNYSLTRSTRSAKRPTTAPNGGTASFDVVQRRPRAMSESLPARPKDLRAEFRMSGIAAPRIPVRRSSLSAPTSRNTSRAVSMTSNTQPFHPLPFERPLPIKSPESPKAPAPPVVTIGSNGDPEGPPLVLQPGEHTHAYASHVDDVAGFYSPLLPPLTPFQASIQSLSPGPIEISEAKAVPFFVHNNESILLVEPSQPTSSRTHQSIRSQPLRLNTDETVTPPTEMVNATVDSPLRNPRPPPKPPVPNSVGTRRATTNFEQVQDIGAIGRRWGSLRRAISLKRQSDISPSITTHRVRNPKAGQDIDDSQQAFWRPRPFWDDVKVSDMDQCTCRRQPNPGTDGQQDTKSGTGFVSNSLGIPQSKVIFQAPISLIRRVSHRNRARNTRPMNVSHISLASSTLSRRSRRNRHYVVPRLGVRLPRYPLKDMREWMARTRRQREEEKLEVRREELRKKIDVVVPIGDNNQHIGAIGVV